MKVGGLHELLVKRRLQIIDDIVATARLDVEVDCVPSEQNLSDQLTRVPTSWLACTSDNSATDVAASLAIMPSLSMAEILAGQEDDGALQAVKAVVIAGDDLPPDSGFRNIRGQLQVQDGVLQRSVKLPPNDVKCVPVLPAALEERAVRAAHQVSGHSGWEATWQLLRSQCHFLGMGQRCQAFVSGCSSCQAANPRRGEATEPTRPVSANGPWDVVHIDTLELGVNRSGRYHCVLVCVDAFTKWVEVVPLKRHDGICVARAFVDVCSRWGPPRVVRSDNGTEFKNAVMSSVYEAFGVHFCYGAARHPQSQGVAERFNQTLLTLVRKVLDEAHDWEQELAMLLYYYRIRPHSATNVSPMEAMVGWHPRGLVVDRPQHSYSAGSWVDDLQQRAAAMRDYIESALGRFDFIDEPTSSRLTVGDAVMLRRPQCCQKGLTPYEPGWQVMSIVGPSTVVVHRVDGTGRDKIVNVDLLRPAAEDNLPPPPPVAPGASDEAESGPVPSLVLSVDPVTPPPPDAGPSLRARSTLVRPARYS